MRHQHTNLTLELQAIKVSVVKNTASVVTELRSVTVLWSVKENEEK
jgi:hypothetical protein